MAARIHGSILAPDWCYLLTDALLLFRRLNRAIATQKVLRLDIFQKSFRRLVEAAVKLMKTRI